MVKFRIKEVASVELLEAYKPDEIWGHCGNCGNHGSVWSCPPHAFDPVEFFKGFEFAYVLIGEVSLKGFDSMDDAVKHYYDQRRKVNRAMLALEKTVPDSVSLFAGHCEACDECTRLKDEPCDKPELCRYSLESLGLKVSDITEKFFNESLQWSKGTTPEKLLTVPALLTHEKDSPEEIIRFLEAEVSA